MRFRSVAVAFTVSAVALAGTTGQPRVFAPRSSYPDKLVWLGLGDSYSSGEGLRFVDANANPPGRDCQRATGTTTVNGGRGSRAWAVVAYDSVRAKMKDSTFKLLACTGAISNEIHAQYRDEWLASHPGVKADLVTLSMGGNNLGFADVIQRCVGLALDNSTGAGIVLNPAIGCDTTEAKLKAKVDQLVGTSGVGPDGGQTLRDMYSELARNAVNHGGHVIVAGYPNIVEESGRWVLGWAEGNRCSRIRRSDATMLRSVTGYLNQQIALLVAQVDRKFNDVSFHWVDVSQVYESDAGGRHGLCAGDPWINGLTFGAWGPHDDRRPLRWERSFHPTQDGHDKTGERVAEILTGLDWSHLDRTVSPSPASPASPQPADLNAMTPLPGEEDCGPTGDVGDGPPQPVFARGMDCHAAVIDVMGIMAGLGTAEPAWTCEGFQNGSILCTRGDHLAAEDPAAFIASDHIRSPTGNVPTT